jgi:acetyl-CoA carboxylase carboxyltransferase component
MSGRAYDTRFVFAWPTAKISIMGPRQLAGVMSIVRRGGARAAGRARRAGRRRGREGACAIGRR